MDLNIRNLKRFDPSSGRPPPHEAEETWRLPSSRDLLLLGMGIGGYYAFVALVAAGGDVGQLDGDAWLALAVAAIAVIFVGVAQWRLAIIAAANDAKAQDLIVGDLEEVSAELPGFGWLDLWASADPAPNGPLFVPPVPGEAAVYVPITLDIKATIGAD